MRRCRCLSFAPGVPLTLLTSFLCLACCAVWSGFVKDCGNLEGLAATWSRELARESDLEALTRVVLRRIEVKDQIVREVVANRLSLREAAARFRDLQAAATDLSEETYLWHYPGGTIDDRYCRAVIARVQHLLQADSTLSREVGARLEAELDSVAKDPV